MPEKKEVPKQRIAVSVYFSKDDYKKVVAECIKHSKTTGVSIPLSSYIISRCMKGIK